MPFKKGVKVAGRGRPRGSKAAQVKSKFIKEWARIFKEHGRSILEDLAKDQPLEFLKLGIRIFPENENDSGGSVNIIIQTSKADEL